MSGSLTGWWGVLTLKGRAGAVAPGAVAPVIAVVGLLLAAGCTGGGPSGGDGAQAPAKLTVAPGNGTEDVAPDKGVTVRVTSGKITDVTVADAKGREAEGTKAEDGSAWRTRWTLRPDTDYTVTARAKGDDGKQVTSKARFSTLEPRRELESGMSPLDGETVGIGMPVQLLLSKPVKSDEAKAAVERSLEVEMSEPVQGAWSWVGDEQVQFRPREYWPSGQKVTVTAHLAGVRAGKDLWGVENRSVEFEVGDRHITTIDAEKHRLTARNDGEVVKKMPVSLGKPGHDTRSGTHIAQEKAADIVMDSATTGNPGEYRIPSKWNVRLTYSGEFVHSAPWSTGSQGSANVSHGCVNAAPSNAKWFFDWTNRGDIIKVTGTTRDLEFGNGPTPWVKSWQEWLEGSALGKPVNGQAAGGSRAPTSQAPAAN